MRHECRGVSRKTGGEENSGSEISEAVNVIHACFDDDWLMDWIWQCIVFEVHATCLLQYFKTTFPGALPVSFSCMLRACQVGDC